MKKWILYIGIGLLVASCDCYKVATGKVIDKTTQQPIAGVKVCLSDQPTTFAYTDSTGSYQIYYVRTGISCYTKVKKKVIAEKESYKKTNAQPAMQTIEIEHKANPEEK